MAASKRQEISLGITRNKGEEAILTLITRKSLTGGISSTALVYWRGVECLSEDLIDDYSARVHTSSARSTQANIDRQHAEIFTLEAIENLKADALAHYAVKELDAEY